MLVMFMFLATSAEAISRGDWIYLVGLLATGVIVWVRLGLLCWAADEPRNQVALAQATLAMHRGEGNSDLGVIKKFQSDLEINKPILTASGFFTVSKSLVLSIYSQIGTYLVILVQLYPADSGSNTVEYGNKNCLAYYY
jgi:hypothetical protein